MKRNRLLFAVVVLASITCQIGSLLADSDRGFIIYCPCMGRFGNQAEQLLGSLLFARSLNRTLVLPPFINYGFNHVPMLVPFEDVIQVQPIKDFHDVILLTDFLNQYGTSIWPPGKRQFYCYAARDQKANYPTCDALRGQPFNTFWTSFEIEEDTAVFHKPLTTNPNLANAWSQEYPPSSHRVLTFVGAPSPFPTLKESIAIQKYIKISKKVEEGATKFKLLKNFHDKPYLSMHIRHGSDWKRACELLRSSEEGLVQLFSSSQCTGYPEKNSPLEEKLHFDTCLPSFETITAKLASSLNDFRVKQGIDIQVVHVATDSDDPDLWRRLRSRFPHIDFITTPNDQSNTMLITMTDIYLMAYSDVLIGNCVSSFSAFPARIRSEQLNLGHATYYFGQNFTRKRIRQSSDEL